MIQQYAQKYIISPITALLKQGLTPQRLALSMAGGIIIGTFPLVGTTTAICTMAAILCGMNLLVAQLGNWLVYPIQLLLVVPFIILGEYLFGSSSSLDPSHFVTLLRTDFWTTLQLFSKMIIHAALAWALCAPIAFAAIYTVLYPLFKLLHARIHGRNPA
jgi:uncharacterized protein (DUF2062 family)